MRRALKWALESVLVRGGAAALARGVARDRSLILAYHNVVPDGTPPFGDRSLHLPRGAFAAQLDELVRHYEVVPLASVLESGEGRRVAITFDDASRGAVTLGVAELARRNLPATIFVAPGFVGGRTFWWDALSRLGGGGVPEGVRAHALDALGGSDSAVRRWANETGRPLAPVPDIAAAASEGELRTAVACGGITLGSHTWNHPNLNRLQSPELDQELSAPLAWLRERFADATIPWLAYPYGLFSPAVEAAAARAGYEAALAIAGGRVRYPIASRYAIPRLNIPSGLSRNGFALRAAGLLGS